MIILETNQPGFNKEHYKQVVLARVARGLPVADTNLKKEAIKEAVINRIVQTKNY